MKNLTFLTIVIPVYNEDKFIASTLEGLLTQDYPSDRFEIIVADGMSDDLTRDILYNVMKNNPQVRLFDNSKRFPSSGRNLGFRNGKGEYFVVIDGHCYIPTDQLFKNISACIKKSGAQCLGRPQPLDPPDISEFQKAVALVRESRIGHSGSSFIYSNYEGYVSPVSHGAIYKREIFEKVGYVDEDFDACEDVEFNYRVEKAGFKTYMSPLLAIKYYPRRNLRGLFKQMARYGEGRFKFIRKHPEAFTLEMIIPAIFVIGICLILILIFLNIISPFSVFNIILVFLIIAYSFYVLLILSESLRITLKSRLAYIYYLPAIFFTIHCGLGWGFLKGVFFLIYTLFRKILFSHKS
jgi:succinoglycan biosynthesis protein ExoA